MHPPLSGFSVLHLSPSSNAATKIHSSDELVLLVPAPTSDGSLRCRSLVLAVESDRACIAYHDPDVGNGDTRLAHENEVRDSDFQGIENHRGAGEVLNIDDIQISD